MWQHWLIWKLVKYAYASYSLRVSAATWRCSGQSWVKWLLYPFSAPCGLWECLGSGCGWCCCGCGCVSGCGSEAGVWLSTRLPPAALTFCFLALARHFATPTRWEGWRGSRVQRVEGMGYGVRDTGVCGTGYWVLNSCPSSSINFVDWFLLKRAQLDTCPTIP